MAHNHPHHHGSKNILLAFFLNAGFAVIELIGGYLTNSVSIYSDALHDFGDSLALLLSYFSEKFSHKSPDKKFTFGYRRFSILSALINGLILSLGSFFVIYEAIQRIMSPQEVMPEGMVVLAILGVLINSYAAYRLSKDDGMNSNMIMFHLLEDLLGWIAVFVVSVILLFKPWYVLDSILSILISFIILRGVYKNLLKLGGIFLQKFPDELELAKMEEEVLALDLVNEIHSVKGWSIDDKVYYICFHVIVPGGTTVSRTNELKNKIKTILKKFNVAYSTLEFESKNSEDYRCKDEEK